MIRHFFETVFGQMSNLLESGNPGSEVAILHSAIVLTRPAMQFRKEISLLRRIKLDCLECKIYPIRQDDTTIFFRGPHLSHIDYLKSMEIGVRGPNVAYVAPSRSKTWVLNRGSVVRVHGVREDHKSKVLYYFKLLLLVFRGPLMVLIDTLGSVEIF